MRCDHRATAGLWPPRHPHPHPPPCGSGVRTELESRPDRRDHQDMASPCHRPHPSVPCASCGCGKMVLLKPAARSRWRYGPCGWFQRDTLRVSVVRYDGCAARASGIQLSVYRVSADLILLVLPGLATVGFPAGYHCLVTFPLMLDLSDLECRSSASGVPERTNLWRIAFSVTP